MGKLTLLEKLEVAKACGMETRLLITPEEADAFIHLLRYLDPERLAAMEANRRAKEIRLDQVSQTFHVISWMLVGGCVGWVLVMAAFAVFWGQ